VNFVTEAAFKESQAKGHNAGGLTRSFLTYGMSSVLPRTEAGKSCQEFLELVKGRRITLDELAAQETQFIIEVRTVTDDEL
jgi:hypothetical protein